jgi:hypothetical protein
MNPPLGFSIVCVGDSFVVGRARWLFVSPMDAVLLTVTGLLK